MDVTAKVVVGTKETRNEGTPYEQVYLGFAVDYADGRNKEWAVATPALTVAMTVKPEVALHFLPGAAYTLTFSPSDE